MNAEPIDPHDPAQMCAVMRLLATLRGVQGCGDLTSKDILSHGLFTGKTVQVSVRGIPFAEFVRESDR